MTAKRKFTDIHKQRIKESVKRYFATETAAARERRINNLKAFWQEVRRLREGQTETIKP